MDLHFCSGSYTLRARIKPVIRHGCDEQKGMTMENEHQPSGVKPSGQDIDAAKRQECAK